MVVNDKRLFVLPYFPYAYAFAFRRLTYPARVFWDRLERQPETAE